MGFHRFLIRIDARILLAQEKPTEALSLLEPLQSGAQRQGRWNQLIEMQTPDLAFVETYVIAVQV